MRTIHLWWLVAVAMWGCSPPAPVDPSPCPEPGTSLVQVFRDADGDGFGTGDLLQVCGTPLRTPAGYATKGGDCDDSSTIHWRTMVAYLDRDGDGFGVGEPVEHCAGLLLPFGFSAQGGDCDDDNSAAWKPVTAFRDEDHDGFGAGDATTACGRGELPWGYSLLGGDCAPQDAARWQLLAYAYRDADGDGRTVQAPGEVCSDVALPRGYSANVGLGLDCDDASSVRFEQIDGYLDEDADGHGAGPLVTQCTGPMERATLVPTNDDCAPRDALHFQLLPHDFVDRDGDGVTVPESGQVCSGPFLTAPYTRVSDGFDCDDADRSVFQRRVAFPDSDGDGFGARTDATDGGDAMLCTGAQLPSGYASNDTDCAPEDSARWMTRTYSTVDVDGDGYGRYQSGTLCSGAALPSGYSTNLGKGLDCDDANPALFAERIGYLDADGDGFGAGSSSPVCTGGAFPQGYSVNATDCAPDDTSRWQAMPYAGVDRDGDGFTVREPGTACVGSPAVLPEPARAVLVGNDCDEADANLWRWVVLYPDADGDGVGTPPRVVQCLGATLPPGYSLYGWDVDDSNPSATTDPDEESLLTTVL